jgi:DNA transformation protein
MRLRRVGAAEARVGARSRPGLIAAMPAIDLLEELFASVGGVTIKRMFGGLGAFKAGLMFALVSDDVLYFKADETTAPKFAGEGFDQWTYEGRGKRVPMPYWQAPDRLCDEPNDFAEWAKVAFEVAVRTQKKPKAAKKATGKAAQKLTTKRQPRKTSNGPATKMSSASSRRRKPGSIDTGNGERRRR